MTQSHHTAKAVRYARLFELIRQDNMVQETTEAAPAKSNLNLAQMQRFLKRADKSFEVGETL